MIKLQVIAVIYIAALLIGLLVHTAWNSYSDEPEEYDRCPMCGRIKSEKEKE